MLRFDDSWQDQWNNVLPVLQEYHFNAAFLAITGYLTSTPYPTSSPDTLQYMNWNEFQWLYNNGYEIVDHSMTHPDFNHVSGSQLYSEVVRSKQLLLNHGINNVPAFALPYGDAWNNQTIMSYILNNGFIHVYSAFGSPALSQYSQVSTVWYPIDSADNDFSLAQFQKFANQASSSVAVGFEFHHVFANSNDVNSTEPYSISLDQFKQDMAWLSSNGFTVIIPKDLPGYYNVPPPPPPPSATTTTTKVTTTSSTIAIPLTSTTEISTTLTIENISQTNFTSTTTSIVKIASSILTNTSSSTLFTTAVPVSSGAATTFSYSSSSSNVSSITTSSFSFINMSVTSAYQVPQYSTSTENNEAQPISLPVFLQPLYLGIAVAAMGLILVSQWAIRSRHLRQK